MGDPERPEVAGPELEEVNVAAAFSRVHSRLGWWNAGCGGDLPGAGPLRQVLPLPSETLRRPGLAPSPQPGFVLCSAQEAVPREGRGGSRASAPRRCTHAGQGHRSEARAAARRAPSATLPASVPFLETWPGKPRQGTRAGGCRGGGRAGRGAVTVTWRAPVDGAQVDGVAVSGRKC